MKHIFTICMMLLLAGFSQAQSEEIVVIGEIKMVGNQKTRKFVLNREMDIRPGDTIALASFQQTLLRNSNLLLNTGLFVSASVTAPEWKNGDREADILVEVNETWYFFPIPVLKLADRNFNVWWEEFDRDFSRIIWGIRLHHYNLTGVRDYLKFVSQFGFSQKYQLRYRYPYLNRAKTLGLEIEANYNRSRNGSYNTRDDQLEFLISEARDNFKSFSGRTSVGYRKGLYTTHQVGAGFISSSISDTVRQLNPNYYINNRSLQRYFSLHYSFKHDRRDRRDQATKGYAIEGLVTQVGLGVYDDLNYGYGQLTIKKYFPVNKKITARVATTGRLYFNKNKIAYNHSSALGYGRTYVRGYELYVIDGTDFVLSHQGMTWQFYRNVWDFGKILPIKKTDVIPIRAFLSANVDVGYVKKPQYGDRNTLDEQWLVGYGPAIEILIAETYLFGFDYSFNRLGESGVFLHTKFNF